MSASWFVKKLLVLLLVLALTACQSGPGPDGSASRPGEDGMSVPALPEPDAAPEPERMGQPDNWQDDLPEEEASSAAGSLEERLLQPFEDERVAEKDGKAFLADTRGRLGQLPVTISCGEEEGTVRVEVWDPENMDTPLQTILEQTNYSVPSNVWADDINFDGHPDIHFDTGYFEYLYLLWNEEEGRFVKTDQLDGLRAPWFDWDQQTVVDEAYGFTYIYQWVQGKLTLMRRITVQYGRDIEGLATLCQAEVYLPDYDTNSLSRYWLLTVEERGYLGEMREVYMEVMDDHNPTFDTMCTYMFDPRWYDLDYHGAP